MRLGETPLERAKESRLSHLGHPNTKSVLHPSRRGHRPSGLGVVRRSRLMTAPCRRQSFGRGGRLRFSNKNLSRTSTPRISQRGLKISLWSAWIDGLAEARGPHSARRSHSSHLLKQTPGMVQVLEEAGAAECRDSRQVRPPCRYCSPSLAAANVSSMLLFPSPYLGGDSQPVPGTNHVRATRLETTV